MVQSCGCQSHANPTGSLLPRKTKPVLSLRMAGKAAVTMQKGVKWTIREDQVVLGLSLGFLWLVSGWQLPWVAPPPLYLPHTHPAPVQ